MSFISRFCFNVILVLAICAGIVSIFYLISNYTLISVCVLVVGGLALLITLSSYDEEEIRNKHEKDSN
jgi:hypothetical protein